MAAAKRAGERAGGACGASSGGPSARSDPRSADPRSCDPSSDRAPEMSAGSAKLGHLLAWRATAYSPRTHERFPP
eukprot:4094674-Alexandrium_andersonii.AAC.1